MSVYSSEVIDPAVPEDAAPIHQLMFESFGESYLKFTIYQSHKATGYLRDQIVSGISTGMPGYFVKRADKDLAGFYAAVRRSDEYFLNYIATDPRERSLGLGGAFLSHFESRARSIGCTSVGLEVFASNDGVRAWYGRHGYRAQSVRYHLRFPVEILSEMAESEILIGESDWHKALTAESLNGFSRVEGSYCGDRVRLGLIDGTVCKVLFPDGPASIKIAFAAARSFRSTRKWVLVSSPERLPEQALADSMEAAVYMAKIWPHAESRRRGEK